MNTEYHVFPKHQHLSYLAAARHLQWSCVLSCSCPSKEEITDAPCTHPWRCAWSPPVCMLRLCNCKLSNLEDHAVLEAQAGRGPGRPLDWGARATEHIHRVRRSSDPGGMLPLYPGLVYQNLPAAPQFGLKGSYKHCAYICFRKEEEGRPNLNDLRTYFPFLREKAFINVTDFIAENT